MRKSAVKKILMVVVLLSFSVLFGCAGSGEYLIKGGFPDELLEADRAVEEARQAGKDTKCPDEFNSAKGMAEKAYVVYWQCRTSDAIDMARVATDKAKALCPVKAEPPPPPKPQPPRTKKMPPPPKPAPKVIDRMTLLVNFDFDKALIRGYDRAKLVQAIEFINKYPNSNIVLEGHTDSIGPKRYNQGLSERRAEAVKRFLVNRGGISESRIRTFGHGELRPVASNKTREGRAENRRVEVLILTN